MELARGREPTASHIEAVARETTAQAAAWAFTQWELRRRAKSKFPEAERMLFTREALEQATPWAVAQYHASRFPRGELVADLTAGIGGDLLALRERGPVVAFELDEERAVYAEWNTGVRVRREDCLAVPWEWEYAFADPSRRSAGRRVQTLDEMTPDPRELARRMKALQLGGMKLSPMIDDRILEELASCVEFLSFRRECLEATIWIGKSAENGRFAVLVREDASSVRLSAGRALPSPRLPEEYAYDVDPAAVRAHCLGALCLEYDLAPLADSVGYLTGPCADSEWFRGYRVLADVAPREKEVRRSLRRLSARISEVKSRVSGAERYAWLRGSGSGDRPLTAILYAVGPSIRAILCEPLDR